MEGGEGFKQVKDFHEKTRSDSVWISSYAEANSTLASVCAPRSMLPDILPPGFSAATCSGLALAAIPSVSISWMSHVLLCMFWVGCLVFGLSLHHYFITFSFRAGNSAATRVLARVLSLVATRCSRSKQVETFEGGWRGVRVGNCSEFKCNENPDLVEPSNEERQPQSYGSRVCRPLWSIYGRMVRHV